MMSSGVKSAKRWAIGVGGSNAGSSGRLLSSCGSESRGLNWLVRTDSLSKTVKNEGQKPRWSQQDAYILVHKCVALLRRFAEPIFIFSFAESTR